MTPLTLARQRHGALVNCLARRGRPVARSSHFTVYGIDPARQAEISLDDLIVVHDFAATQIDNDIGAHVADELLPLLSGPRIQGALDGYAYTEQEVFERYVGEIVRSIDGNERRAWHLFYDNTLAALRSGGQARDSGEARGFTGDFSAIYQRVASLAAEVPHAALLDVGTCFGFLPLLLAAGRRNGAPCPSRIVGCDLNPALVALAGDYARQRGLANVSFVRADILAGDIERELAPVASAFDVVTAIHLLEHLEPEQSAHALTNLWRLARQRLIVAVPLEAEPDARFGHRQVFDRERLLVVGRRSGASCRYFEHRGGWIVLDRRRDHDPQGRERT